MYYTDTLRVKPQFTSNMHHARDDFHDVELNEPRPASRRSWWKPHPVVYMIIGLVIFEGLWTFVKPSHSEVRKYALVWPSKGSPYYMPQFSAPRPPVASSGSQGAVSAQPDVTIVVASILKDNTSWIDEHLSHWNIVKYVTDDPNAEHIVPINKGHEAMVYLTYIVDNYHKLPEVMIFSHSQQYQWHNDDRLFDGARMLSHVQIPYIKEVGYTSLRCNWKYGCPAEVHPLEHGDEDYPEGFSFITDDAKPYVFKKAFQAMFPGDKVPEEVGAPCCAQFGVTGDTVRGRDLADYKRIRQWLIDADMPDATSGRVFEYVWHMIFQKPAVYCPSAESCYCRLYGKCHLTCPDESRCEDQWFLPHLETLPTGWPEVGFEGEKQDVKKLRKQQDKDYRS